MPADRDAARQDRHRLTESRSSERTAQVRNYLDPEPFTLAIPRVWVATVLDLLTVHCTSPFSISEPVATYDPSRGGC